MIKTDTEASDIVHRSVRDGWEPHFAVAMDDIKDELLILADQLGLEAIVY